MCRFVEALRSHLRAFLAALGCLLMIKYRGDSGIKIIKMKKITGTQAATIDSQNQFTNAPTMNLYKYYLD